ncbi:protein containing DUF497 [Candidatus Magnetomorum sp. HK-1]|nr:protein containing DUF497 [Candidatus Magnetomorum sp. HK-1]
MKFIWDTQKNQKNIRKHKIDLRDAYLVFQNPILVNVDDREDYGEDRFIGIGLLDMRVVIIVFTEIDDETIRVISLRKAIRKERKQYEKAYSNRFECY